MERLGGLMVVVVVVDMMIALVGVMINTLQIHATYIQVLGIQT
jgi:hypothetical protein